MSSITDQILGAWDDEEAPAESAADVVEPDTTPETEEVQDEATPAAEEEEEEEVSAVVDEEETPEPGEEVEEEEGASEEEEAEEPSGDEEEPATATFEDPEIQAYLARHGDDVEAALRAAVHQSRRFGLQGRELGQLRQQVADLEAQIDQAQMFSQGASFLSPEQAQWVEEAVGSDNAIPYIQSAVEAGEFDLARAVLDQGEFTAAQVVRLSQGIDVAQGRAMQQGAVEYQPLDHGALMGVLVDHYPDMPQFEADMVSTLQTLGPDHPLAALAQSQDPAEAAQGIIGLYEIARAKTATVESTRAGVKTKRREAADAARRDAQVSSAQATPSQAQTPRRGSVMPGLTLEALEAEFEND